MSKEVSIFTLSALSVCTLLSCISCVDGIKGRIWLLAVSAILLVILIVLESVSLWKSNDIQSRLKSLFSVDADMEMENLSPDGSGSLTGTDTEYNQQTADYLLDQMSRYYRYIFRDGKDYEERPGSKVIEKIRTENNTQLSCIILEVDNDSVKALVILFKGTTSAYEWSENMKYSSVSVPSSWHSNRDVVVDGIKMHKGFVECYDSMRTHIYKHVVNYKNIYICGHSLGAAMAQLCSFDCLLQKIPTYCIAIASPRVGNDSFADFMSDKNLYQLRNDSDFVTTVPTAWITNIRGENGMYEYVHAGTFYVFNAIESNLGMSHMLSTYKKHTNKDKLNEVKFNK